MATPVQRKKLSKLINRFADASVAMSWIGQQHPEDRPRIKAEFKEAKEKMNKYLDDLLRESEWMIY